MFRVHIFDKPNKTIQENMKELEDLLPTVKVHPMTLKFEETPQHYTVIFPAGEFGIEAHGRSIGGCRVSKGMGKIKALETLLSKLEYYWESSQVGYIPSKI